MKFLALLVALCVSGALAQQAGSPDDCLMSCTKEMSQQSSPDVMNTLEVERVQVGNETVFCPRVNDTAKFDRNCAKTKQFFQCAEPCPDTPIKKLTLGAFVPSKFACIDRADDIKKYMPCLSENCAQIQGSCISKCGSLDAQAQNVSRFMMRVHGGASAGGPVPGGPGPAGSGSAAARAARQANGQNGPPKDVDMSEILKFIGDKCSTLSCFVSCTETPTTKLCGKEAHLLQRDIVMLTFQGMAQSMSSVGMQIPWPAECRPLLQSVNTTGGTNATTSATGTGAVKAGTAAGTTAGTIQATQASTTPAGTAGTATTPKGTTAGGTSPAAVNATSALTEASPAAKSKQCDKPPCSGPKSAVISTLLVLLSIVLHVFRD